MGPVPDNKLPPAIDSWGRLCLSRPTERDLDGEWQITIQPSVGGGAFFFQPSPEAAEREAVWLCG